MRSDWPSMTPGGICTSTERERPPSFSMTRRFVPAKASSRVTSRCPHPPQGEAAMAAAVRAAEQAREKIAEAVQIGKPLAAAALPEALGPIRRRPKLLPRPIVPP